MDKQRYLYTLKVLESETLTSTEVNLIADLLKLEHYQMDDLDYIETFQINKGIDVESYTKILQKLNNIMFRLNNIDYKDLQVSKK